MNHWQSFSVGLALGEGFSGKACACLSFFRRDVEPAPPARHHDGKITDVQFEIVDRTNDRTPRP